MPSKQFKSLKARMAGNIASGCLNKTTETFNDNVKSTYFLGDPEYSESAAVYAVNTAARILDLVGLTEGPE